MDFLLIKAGDNYGVMKPLTARCSCTYGVTSVDLEFFAEGILRLGREGGCKIVYLWFLSRSSALVRLSLFRVFGEVSEGYWTSCLIVFFTLYFFDILR